MSPYPVPTWGWEICETPWACRAVVALPVHDGQGLSAATRLRADPRAVLFLVDYMKRPEAHGPQWGDDKYHVFPTVPPELYGLKPGFKYTAIVWWI